MASSLQASQLSQCYGCHHPLSLPSDIDKEFVMPVCCYKILRFSDLKNWAHEKKKSTCAYCAQPIDITKAGKSVDVIWKIFQIATAIQPKDVITVFDGGRLIPTTDNEPFLPDTHCPISEDPYPDLGICYLPSAQRFSHTQCLSSIEDYQEIPLSMLSWLAKELVSKHPDLAQNFKYKKV